MTKGTSSGPQRQNTVPIIQDLEGTDFDIPPPAYGDHHDQLQLSQAGFAAGAAVTDDGRVNINISEKNRRLSQLLGPALQRQLLTDTRAPSEPLPPAYIPPSLGGQPGQTPPPRLNVVIQIVGSRGDVQPFVALGQVLRDTYGHRVRLATHATFKSFVEENGLEFFNIGGDPAELMAFMVKNPGLMPGLETIASGEIKKRRQGVEQILNGCWRSCVEAGNGMGAPPPPRRADETAEEQLVLPGSLSDRPFVADAIIANPPSFAHIHLAEKLGIPLHMMFTMPWTPTRAFPHPLADIASTNADDAMTNYVSYALVEMMTWQGLGDMINRFRIHVLDLEPISLLWAPGLLTRLRIPTTYCWSPALTPKPADWAKEITVAGFYFLNLESAYTPEPDLAAFLRAGPPPVYIGFGSIVVDDPDALTRTIFEAIARTGVRALVSKGWGGIGGEAMGLPDGVFMLGNCPHDWLFKHVSAVVHHGGAGTTAAGIKAGKPTVVVPFFGDQIFWGSMIARAGAGPVPIPYKKLTSENLATAIETALRPECKARAQQLGEKIREEKGTDVGCTSFHQFLNIDNMRCSLAPSRAAVWRVRRTKIRLSALAATVLVKEGWLKYSDLKLYRPIEYDTEEQPWDPITAVVAALLGDIGALTMALADFPREIFKATQARKEGTKASSTISSPPGDGSPLTTSSRAMASADSISFQSLHSRSASASVSSTTGVSAQGSVEALSPAIFRQQTQSPTTPGTPSRPPLNSETPSTSTTTKPADLDMAIGAGKGVMRIVGAGMKFHTNFCLGLARGFRNAPKLYNDDTVRPTEKVTGFASGVKVAGKEFGLGFYDGLAGLVTQPMKGAEKEGGRGLLKGIGKGIAGLALKPAAGIWALPAYVSQGITVEMRGLFKRAEGEYILASRVKQGEEDFYAGSTAEERRNILARWQARDVREQLKGFWSLKEKQKEPKKKEVDDGQGGVEERRGKIGASEEVERAFAGRPRWFRGRSGRGSVVGATDTTSTAAMSAEANIPLRPPATASSASSSYFPLDDDEALESAILESVAQTSRGDREEDARVEAAIRASVRALRSATGPGSDSGQVAWEPDRKVLPQMIPEPHAGDGSQMHLGGVPHEDEDLKNITDEEYQALIEEAVRRSLLEQQQEEEQEQWGEVQANPSAGLSPISTTTATTTATATATAQPVFELPVDIPSAGPATITPTEDGANDEEEQLRRAIEESEREHRSRVENLQRQKTEEEIVLEYVMRQSLAEEEYRRAAWKGKGVARQEPGEQQQEQQEEDDEELRRALEYSKMSRQGGAGPSRTR